MELVGIAINVSKTPHFAQKFPHFYGNCLINEFIMVQIHVFQNIIFQNILSQIPFMILPLLIISSSSSNIEQVTLILGFGKNTSDSSK